MNWLHIGILLMGVGAVLWGLSEIWSAYNNWLEVRIDMLEKEAEIRAIASHGPSLKEKGPKVDVAFSDDPSSSHWSAESSEPPV